MYKQNYRHYVSVYEIYACTETCMYMVFHSLDSLLFAAKTGNGIMFLFLFVL